MKSESGVSSQKEERTPLSTVQAATLNSLELRSELKHCSEKKALGAGGPHC